jgi:hypothetical protein
VSTPPGEDGRLAAGGESWRNANPGRVVAIFHKRDVRLTGGSEHLRFYNSALDRYERTLPCK